MKVILSFYGLVIGILIVSIYFNDVSLGMNIFLDIVAGGLVVNGIVVIVERINKNKK